MELTIAGQSLMLRKRVSFSVYFGQGILPKGALAIIEHTLLFLARQETGHYH